MARGALRVLFVTPELAPWAKTGGLGEVCFDLARALKAAGVDLRVLTPAYPGLLEAFPGAPCVAQFDAPGGALAPARLLHVPDPLSIYLLDCPAYYARSGLYQSPEGHDWPDNYLRFGLLSRIAAALAGAASPLAWRPQVTHCHDWQAGPAAAYLAHAEREPAPTVMTIHNMGFQGIFPPQALDELGLPRSTFTLDGLEYYGNISFLKAGLSYATRLTTVSSTYAREIQGPELGFGMDALLRRRAGELSGITNGVDVALWDPARDPFLDQPYDLGCLDRKPQNKLALQRELGLREDAGTPLFGAVCRLTWQKGLDILIEAAPAIAALGAQIVVHGDGDHEMGRALRELSAQNPREIAVQPGFEDRLHHRIIAGADALLLPSRYEPCGLTQFQGARCGTIPVAHRTGGLADTVVDATEQNLRAGTATGFLFGPLSAATVVGAARRALDAYRAPTVWGALQRAVMARDCGWAAAVKSYIEVYRAASATSRSAAGAEAPVLRNLVRDGLRAGARTAKAGRIRPSRSSA